MAKIKNAGDSSYWRGCGNSPNAGGIASWYNHFGNQSGSFSDNWEYFYQRTPLYHSWAYTQRCFKT
jgi:hypothetical protein